MIGKKCSFFSSICFIYVLTTFLYGNITVELEVDNNQIFYGESLQLQINIDGGDETAVIDTSNLEKDFQVKFVGDQSKNISSVRIINGQVTKQEFKGHLFVYSLTPKTSGSYTLGPISVKFKNNSYQSNRVSVHVAGAEKGEYAFIKINTPKKEYIIGEQFSISLEIYIKKLGGVLSEHDPLFPQDPPMLTIPWLQGEQNGLIIEKWQTLLQKYLVNSSKPGFGINDINAQDDSIFSIFESSRAKFMFPREIVNEVSPTGKANDYIKYTLKHEVEAEKEGTYLFGPVLLKGLIASRALQDGRAEAKKIVVVADACEIKIANVPIKGRPAYYSGAVGSNFEISAQLLNKTAYVGDLLDLIIMIKGKGQIANIIPLKISEQEQVTKYFKIYDDNVNVEFKGDYKKFQYSLRPNAIVKEFPPVYFSYFDVETRSYKTIKSKSVPIEIKEAESVPDDEILTTIKENKENLLKKIDEGIYGNYEKEDALISQKQDYSKVYFIILAAWPCLYSLLFMVVSYQRKWGNNTVYQRKRRALKVAKDSWSKALKLDAKAQYNEASNILRCYVADHFNLNEQALVSGEILQILGKKVSQEQIQILRDFFELCESIQYGADASTDNVPDLNELLESVEKQL